MGYRNHGAMVYIHYGQLITETMVNGAISVGTVGEVMYFGCVCFRGELGFLNCDDI